MINGSQQNSFDTKIKPSYDTNRIMLGERLPLDTPFAVILDSSEKCNFKCNYCFRSSETKDDWSYAGSNALMSMETLELAAGQLLEFPSHIKTISLSGHGEPLCNPFLPDMVVRLKEMGLTGRIDIHTNASLLMPEMAVSLAASRIDRVIVSLQGLDAASYKKTCRININFERFYDNLKRLYKQKSAGTAIHIKIADAALSSAEDERCFYRMFSPVADSVFVEKIVPLWNQTNTGKDAVTTANMNKYGESFGYIEYCPMLFYNLTVAPDGSIFPCPQIPPPFSLGNIKDTTLLDAWNSDERRNFLRQHLRKGRKNHPRCGNCFIPQNTVKVKEDIVDPYRDDILERLG
jgi:radical SAM protein with 4Fe4S-binding SPASM domain